MAKAPDPEGAQFVRYFGPLLDALRELGGSGAPGEVVERIANDLHVSDEVQNSSRLGITAVPESGCMGALLPGAGGFA